MFFRETGESESLAPSLEGESECTRGGTPLSGHPSVAGILYNRHFRKSYAAISCHIVGACKEVECLPSSANGSIA